jgi:hypothetical protein
LSELATLAQIAPVSALNKIMQEFSAILFDIRIGNLRKRTHGGRLRETERVICKRLGELRSAELTILDIGGSDGVTTLDLVEAIRTVTSKPVKAVLADKDLWLVAYRRGLVTEYRTRSGEPVMVRCGRLGFRLPASEYAWDIFSNILAKYYLTWSRFRASLREERQIGLVNPGVLLEEAILPVEMNCLAFHKEFREQIDVIRASNVLNPRYFTREQIAQTIRHCYMYLKPGGFLVVSRNHDERDQEVERGSIWVKIAENFQLEEEFNGGSEITPLPRTLTGVCEPGTAQRVEGEYCDMTRRGR